MTFKTLDDIERKKEEEEKKEFKEDVAKDIKDIFSGVFDTPKKPKKKKKNWVLRFLKWLGILFLGLLIINFILGNIWLIRFLLKDLFGG